MAKTFLRLRVVIERTGLPRSSIYQKISEGTFPKPISLGARAVAWLDSDVTTWMEAQIKHSRGRR